MDAWLKTTKPMAGPARSKRPKPSTRAPVPSTSLIPINGGVRLANKAFLGTLKDEDNPVTHSDAVSRSFKLQSCATGHQSGDSGGGLAWAEARVLKLQNQSAPTAEGKGVLKGVRVYINGYTGSITNLQLIALVQANGGDVALHFSASRCTHILSEQGLSGSKSQKVLTSKSKVRVVKPAWAVDSVTKGKRLNEARYAVVRSEAQPSVFASFASDPVEEESTAIPVAAIPVLRPPVPAPAPVETTRPRTRQSSASERASSASDSQPTVAMVLSSQESMDEWELPPSAQRPRR